MFLYKRSFWLKFLSTMTPIWRHKEQLVLNGLYKPSLSHILKTECKFLSSKYKTRLNLRILISFPWKVLVDDIPTSLDAVLLCSQSTSRKRLLKMVLKAKSISIFGLQATGKIFTKPWKSTKTRLWNSDNESSVNRKKFHDSIKTTKSTPESKSKITLNQKILTTFKKKYGATNFYI